ncbi:MAG: hypothetical protein WCW04_01435 [Candidatus Paceibacterota bacterium]
MTTRYNKNMKPDSYKTWLIISIIIIGNIMVFVMLSKKLENYVVVKMDSQEAIDVLKL